MSIIQFFIRIYVIFYALISNTDFSSINQKINSKDTIANKNPSIIQSLNCTSNQSAKILIESSKSIISRNNNFSIIKLEEPNKQNKDRNIQQFQQIQRFNQQNKQLNKRLLAVINTSKQYVINGNFSDNACLGEFCTFTLSSYDPLNIVGWIPDPQIQIGKAHYYISDLGQTKILELASTFQTCIRQNIIGITTALYQLNYTIQARSGISLDQGRIGVYLNDTKIESYASIDYNLTLRSINILQQTDYDWGWLKFCGESIINDGSSIVLVNVSFHQIGQLVGDNSSLNYTQIQSPTQLIFNNNFQLTTCQIACCVYNTNGYTLDVDGWYPNPQLQIGYANIYDSVNETNYVAQLIGYYPTCIYQNVTNLSPRQYTINYTSKAESRLSFPQNKFGVYFNQTKIDDYLPISYQITTRSLNITIIQDNSWGILKLCGQPVQYITTSGCMLYNVTMRRIQKVVIFPFILNPSSNTINSTNLTENININSSISNFSNNSSIQSIFITNLLSQTINSIPIKALNKVPARRSIFKSFSSFSINLDHLWLYIYHKKYYGQYTQTFLQGVDSFEDEQINYLSNQFIENNLKLNISYIQDNIDYKINYTSQKFLKQKSNGNYFIVNNLTFFIINIPLIILTFLFGRLLYTFKNSTFLRQFSYNYLILLMILEGNVQSFSYYFTTDCQQLFSFHINMKIMNGLTILAFGLFIFVIVSLYFLLKSVYNNEVNYLLQNCKLSLTGQFYILIHSRLLSFLLGMANSFIENYSQPPLLILALVQILYIVSLIIIIKVQRKIFEHIFQIWLNLLSSLLRIYFIISLILYNKQSNQSNLIEQIHKFILTSYVNIWTTSIAFNVLLLLKTILLKIPCIKTYANQKAQAKLKNSQRNAALIISQPARNEPKHGKTIERSHRINKGEFKLFKQRSPLNEGNLSRLVKNSSNNHSSLVYKHSAKSPHYLYIKMQKSR